MPKQDFLQMKMPASDGDLSKQVADLRLFVGQLFMALKDARTENSQLIDFIKERVPMEDLKLSINALSLQSATNQSTIKQIIERLEQLEKDLYTTEGAEDAG